MTSDPLEARRAVVAVHRRCSWRSPTPVLGFYGALKPDPHNTTNYNWVALYYTLALIALAALWFAVCRVLYPDRVRNAAAHAVEHHGVAPLDENLDFTPAA